MEKLNFELLAEDSKDLFNLVAKLKRSQRALFTDRIKVKWGCK